MTQEARRFFRIVYPVGSRARIELNDQQFAVQDLSQGGIKFEVTNPDDDWLEDDPIEGKIYMLTGEKAQVSGKVLRVAENFIVAELSKEVPLKLMYDEHRYIIKNFADKVKSNP